MPAKMAQISPLGRRSGCQDLRPPSAPPGGFVKTRQQRKNPPRFGVHLGNPGLYDGARSETVGWVRLCSNLDSFARIWIPQRQFVALSLARPPDPYGQTLFIGCSNDRRAEMATAATTAAVATKPKKQPKPLPAPNSDFYEVYETLNPEELATVKRVRTFMEAKVAPVITKYWVDDAFPFELLPAVKELGIGGIAMQGYGCAGGSLALLGFVQMEIARIDPSFSTFMGVHNGLAMGSIYIDGSEEQKQKWLPPMARFEKIGCFGLTEPLVGSGASGGLLTTAKREGDSWILNGEKRWIGNAPWCDVSIIWARDLADNQVKGFIVENKTTPGFAQDCAQGRPERPHHAEGRSSAGNKPLAGRQLVPRHREGAEDDTLRRCVDGDGMRDGRLRGCTQV